MPNIAQQDYIIIDWEGKSESDSAKKAEVDAQLKNIYLANPLALFSVVFKNYSKVGDMRLVFSFVEKEGTIYITLYDTIAEEGYLYSFDIA